MCAYYTLKVSQICHDDTPLNVDTTADIHSSASHTAGLLYFPLQDSINTCHCVNEWPGKVCPMNCKPM
ncbi:hypothetical protein SRHO_G00216890 [Serrasalmus rhombeus]